MFSVLIYLQPFQILKTLYIEKYFVISLLEPTFKNKQKTASVVLELELYFDDCKIYYYIFPEMEFFIILLKGVFHFFLYSKTRAMRLLSLVQIIPPHTINFSSSDICI
jgi:hypothetical protein